MAKGGAARCQSAEIVAQPLFSRELYGLVASIGREAQERLSIDDQGVHEGAGRRFAVLSDRRTMQTCWIHVHHHLMVRKNSAALTEYVRQAALR